MDMTPPSSQSGLFSGLGCFSPVVADIAIRIKKRNRVLPAGACTSAIEIANYAIGAYYTKLVTL
jgi:hypothetical protein